MTDETIFHTDTCEEAIGLTVLELLKGAKMVVVFPKSDTEGYDVEGIDIDFLQYQLEVDKASFYPGANTGSLEAIVYGGLAMSGEVGEANEKIKKIWRDKDGIFSEEDKLEIVKELGDVMFYITRIASELGYDLEDVAQINVDKFLARKENGTLQGSGDNR